MVFTPYLGVKMLPDDQTDRRRPRRDLFDTRTIGACDELISLGGAPQVHRRRQSWHLLFVAAGVGMAAVKQQFFPSSDRPEVLVEVQLPEGTSIEATTAAVEKVEAWLKTQPEAKIVTRYIGQGAPRFFFAMIRNCLIRPSPRSSC